MFKNKLEDFFKLILSNILDIVLLWFCAFLSSSLCVSTQHLWHLLTSTCKPKLHLQKNCIYLKSGEYFSWNYDHIYRKHAFPLGITPASQILDCPDTLPIKADLHL